MDKEMTFEEAIESLESIVKELEDDQITLEASIMKYKKGMTLVKHCNASIDQIEKELEIINAKEDE